ncbi:hypothetical protein LT85_0469 [Collimonas arenae]|uniref:Uncharacterized protein n=1 Tax=Collimonas arenae TaxID=279058 RepID=A0A0A1F7G3_9BURK|nr:hypothetical protein LT85_0469 [Collimonas arenae]
MGNRSEHVCPMLNLPLDAGLHGIECHCGLSYFDWPCFR